MKRPSEGYVPLFQERWRREPFWMLVGCVLVNRTTWAKAKEVHARLRAYGKSHYGLIGDDGPAHHELEEMLRPLGLYHRRADAIVRLCNAWEGMSKNERSNLTREDVEMLPGCGKYAADAWAIFVEGRRVRGVTDKRLLEYLRRTPTLWPLAGWRG